MNNLNFRFHADRRQLGGMLMVTGFCAVIHPIANIVNAFNADGALNTDPSTIPFWGMVGAFSLFLNGVASVIVGFAACTMDSSHIIVTTVLTAINQLCWIPYITDMTNVGKMASSDPAKQGLVPAGHNPTETDVKFVASIGVIAIACYGFAYVGSLSFMAFGLHSMNTGKYDQRPSGYYKGRLTFYSLVLTIGGGAQLALGAYSAAEFGTGALEEGRIRAAMLIVNYPVVSILVGSIQVLHGLWGIARSFGVHSGPRDNIYQLSLAGQWLIVLCFQDIMQLAYFPLNVMTPMAAGIAAISFGINMMPAYLDAKMRNTPEEIPEGYYIEVPQKDVPSISFPLQEQPIQVSTHDIDSVTKVKEEHWT
ncbi:expressed unknown protein [Seminavis robusta]|uniref:Uncharacterized protein n=1 Tax=Seminavis robusta TaxID=568900 RepID=A0A9N8DKZ1_9STRA|nr:expressed unknown protein [Seminavis robusta]|eukprot:Sro139_g065210.1 n/a (365) ;mRNA; r:92480-93877